MGQQKNSVYWVNSVWKTKIAQYADKKHSESNSFTCMIQEGQMKLQVQQGAWSHSTGHPITRKNVGTVHFCKTTDTLHLYSWYVKPIFPMSSLCFNSVLVNMWLGLGTKNVPWYRQKMQQCCVTKTTACFGTTAVGTAVISWWKETAFRGKISAGNGMISQQETAAFDGTVLAGKAVTS